MKARWKFKLEYWQAPSRQWYFHMRSRNGKIIAQSEGYGRWRDCESTMALFEACSHLTVFIPKEVSHAPDCCFTRP